MTILTRYLYNTDEVMLSFTENLLKQKDINECYFWIYEYFKSGFIKETWEILYKIYYDFYAIKNPKFLKKMNLRYNKCKKDNNAKHVLWITKNMFKFNKDYNLFLLRIYYSTRNTTIIKIDNTVLDDYSFKNKNEKKLLVSIQKKNTKSISYYLKKIIKQENVIEFLEKILKINIVVNDFYDLYHQLLYITINSFKIKSKKAVYYKKLLDDELNGVLLSDTNCYKEKVKNEIYISRCIDGWLNNAPQDFEKIFPNTRKQIEFVMKQEYEDIKDALGKLWLYKDESKIIEYNALLFFGLIMDEILLEMEKSEKILQEGRLYGVSENIGCFNLNRDKTDTNNVLWYHWEYYAYNSPLWKLRFDKYNITINDEKKRLTFDMDDEAEEFYELYNYEPDEESKEVQEKSTKMIVRKSLKSWLNNIFDKQTNIGLRGKISY
jgi:hypothetical protein